MKLRELFSDESKWWGGGKVTNDTSKCFCLLTGLTFCYQQPEYDRARLLIYDYIKPVAHMTAWNDAPERTFADIRRLVETLDI